MSLARTIAAERARGRASRSRLKRGVAVCLTAFTVLALTACHGDQTPWNRKHSPLVHVGGDASSSTPSPSQELDQPGYVVVAFQDVKDPNSYKLFKVPDEYLRSQHLTAPQIVENFQDGYPIGLLTRSDNPLLEPTNGEGINAIRTMLQEREPGDEVVKFTIDCHTNFLQTGEKSRVTVEPIENPAEWSGPEINKPKPGTIIAKLALDRGQLNTTGGGYNGTVISFENDGQKVSGKELGLFCER